MRDRIIRAVPRFNVERVPTVTVQDSAKATIRKLFAEIDGVWWEIGIDFVPHVEGALSNGAPTRGSLIYGLLR